ncbi:MAG: hypothetical protein Q9214_006563, partial [Letrouitia sp. 1 TL-2023]
TVHQTPARPLRDPCDDLFSTALLAATAENIELKLVQRPQELRKELCNHFMQSIQDAQDHHDYGAVSQLQQAMAVVVTDSLSQYAYYVKSRTEVPYLIENAKAIAADEYNAEFAFLTGNEPDPFPSSCYLRSSSLPPISPPPPPPPPKFLEPLPVDDRMERAVKVVQAGTYTRNKAAELYKVNKDTLKRRIEVSEVTPSSDANRVPSPFIW